MSAAPADSLNAAVKISDEIRYVFGGHVHRQTLYYQGQGRGLMAFAPTAGAAIPVSAHRRWIATIGSVGQPRDGRTDAMYALFDRDKAQLTFARVPYDYGSAADAIRAAGLPEFFADRLLRGPMKLLEPGETLDGFVIEDCVHSGGMAHIYKVKYANGLADPGFPMAMKIPRMTAGDGAEKHRWLRSRAGNFAGAHWPARARDLSRRAT
jgi:diadenosine tetraphosphatase ApaH/serine/threonine PP2A family protein phosphatase